MECPAWRSIQTNASSSHCKLMHINMDLVQLFCEVKPIGYASKLLAQIEKELYAVLFGCAFTSKYIYAVCVCIHATLLWKVTTSHLNILCKSCLQQCHQGFRGWYNIRHKSLSDCDNYFGEGMDVQVHTALSSLPLGDSKLQEIKIETEKDP